MSHRIATSATRAVEAMRAASLAPSTCATGHNAVLAAASMRPTIVGVASTISAPTPHRSYVTSFSSLSSSRLSNPFIRNCVVRPPLASSSPSHRRCGISSSPLQLDKESQQSPPTDGDECPNWQNPLHHNNPAFTKVFAEDFAPGEEMPVVPLPPLETPENEGKVLASPELHALADEIVRLSMMEVKELVDRVGGHFGLVDDDEDDYVSGGGSGGADAGEAAKEEVVEKTVFDLKLVGFDEKSKIKVIKEIRGITALGLKEAKDLVEGAPTTVKKNIKKEEAEELKQKLEAVGATIEIV